MNKPDPEYPLFLRNVGYMHGDPIPSGYRPVSADEMAEMMAPYFTDAANRITNLLRLDRPMTGDDVKRAEEESASAIHQGFKYWMLKGGDDE